MKVQMAPTTWRIKRKGAKFVLRSNPGKQTELSMPVSLVLKNILKKCKTTKEVKSILNENEVIIDGKRRKDYKYPLGVMDVISFPITDEHYRMIITEKTRLDLIKIDKKESKLKPTKIIGKKILGKDKIQLNLFDGRNITIKKNDYSVGDTIVFKLPEQEIKEKFSMEKGNFVFLYKGKKKGEQGTIEEVKEGKIKIKNANGDIIMTEKEYAFVIGKNKPFVKITN